MIKIVNIFWYFFRFRHMKLELLNRLTVKEDACTLCFDKQACTILLPCKHKGFCKQCSKQLETCPMCRAKIASTEIITWATPGAECSDDWELFFHFNARKMISTGYLVDFNVRATLLWFTVILLSIFTFGFDFAQPDTNCMPIVLIHTNHVYRPELQNGRSEVGLNLQV